MAPREPGPPEAGPDVPALFLRALGGVYLVAFASLWVQVEGLVGADGVLPVRDLLALARERLGPSRYWVLPTVFWLADSDAALHAVCALGVAASVAALLGRARAALMAGLWVLYLSLAVAARDFLAFQWDTLLLEAGLLAVFLAPRGLARPRPGGAPLLVVWLYRWLLFRLMFGSGVVKLRSGDEAWRSLTALQVHYETQPLPTGIGYYAHQLPDALHVASAALLFLVELLLPLLIVVPGRGRRLAAAGFLLLQVLIAATGNYAFFNLLSAALCLFLLQKDHPPGAPAPDLFGTWPRAVLAPFALVVALVSLLQLTEVTLRAGLPWPDPVAALARALSPLRSINSYGLFAVMTTRRPELVLEGSEDGRTWRAYAFRWKPGDPSRRPRFVAPHQPRLDWQMWFAALGTCEGSPWLHSLFRRLLEASPPVLSLLGHDPFQGRRPLHVRALLWDYRFTDLQAGRSTGAWWRREPLGLFCPVATRAVGP